VAAGQDLRELGDPRGGAPQERGGPLPPTFFLGALIAMVALHLLLPVVRLVEGWWRLAGVVPLMAGAVFATGPSMVFDRRGTTVKPFEAPSVLVTGGWYRVSRNPMYVGLVLILVGCAALLGTLGPVAVIPAFAWLLDRRFIRPEEAALEDAFGEGYRAYRARVRRWL
jgi:protein-S-isoprenylcysteine O-methyltransferase Ste14